MVRMSDLLCAAIVWAAATLVPFAHASAQSGVYKTSEQIRADLNFPEQFQGGPRHAQSTRIAIMDTGFIGLADWLASHPEEAEKTHIFGDSLDIAESVMPTRHGFDAYRVMRELAPYADIHIYKLYNLNMIPAGFAAMREKGVSVVSLSVGWRHLYPMMNKQWDDYFETWVEAANDNEIFVVMAAGNHGDDTHSLVFIDGNKDGMADIRLGGDPSPYFPVFKPEGQSIDVTVYTEWHESDPPAFEVVLVDEDQEIIGRAASKADGVANVPVPAEGERYWAQIHSTELTVGAPIVIVAEGASGSSRYYNGEDSVPYQARFESPFFAVAGAYWNIDGTLKPLEMSSRGRDIYGDVLPHVLGPGTILLEDGTKLSGTSVAAPALAALYAPLSRNYSLKELIAATSDFSRLEESEDIAEYTRYGVPDFSKLLPGGATRVFGSPEVTGFQTHTKDGRFGVAFELDQCCMNGMSVRAILVAVTADGNGGWKPYRDEQNKPVIVRGEWEKPYNGKAEDFMLGGIFEQDVLPPGDYSVQAYLHYKAWPTKPMQVAWPGDVTFTVN